MTGTKVATVSTVVPISPTRLAAALRKMADDLGTGTVDYPAGTCWSILVTPPCV